MSKLKDLFVSKEAELYAGTSRTSDVRFAQPFIERKPNDPDRHANRNDSRGLPLQSSVDQIERIGKYFTSPSGIKWLALQRILRTQSARPDLRSGKGLILGEALLSSEILASLAPPVRGERYGSSLFGLIDEKYSNSGVTTPLGSKISDKADSDRLDIKMGMTNYHDRISNTTVVDENQTLVTRALERSDLIPFYFIDMVNQTRITFRATVTSFNETVSPEWNSEKYIGRPFNIYSYNGVERTVSFTFTIYPMNASEVISNFTKYNYLVGLCFPSGYVGNDRQTATQDLLSTLPTNVSNSSQIQNQTGYIQPPFVKFTVGNMFKRQPAIITSINMSVPDESSWEIGDTRTSGRSATDKLNLKSLLGQLKKLAVNQLKSAIGVGQSYDVGEKVPGFDEYKLPHIMEINVGLTILENGLFTTGDPLYGFEPRT